MFHLSSHPLCFTTLAATRRCRCLLRGAFMWVVMPWRPVPCDLGDPGGGDPWFPHGTLLLHSLAGMAWWSGCLVLICCFAIPHGDDTKLSPLASINPFPYELEPVTMLFCLCWLFFGLFGFVSLCFCVFVFCVLLVFFVLFLLCLDDYIVTVHRTT